MKEIFCSSLILIFAFSFAQNYTPIDTADSEFRSQLKADYESKFEVYKSKLKANFEGKKRAELLNAFSSFKEEFLMEVEEGNFVKDDRLQHFLDEILVELQNKNPEIPKNLKILVAKYPNINAYALPDGILVMNMGSFKFLENEDQLASIIAHEIAHNQLEHVLKSQLKQIEKDLSGEYKNKIKSIKQKKFGRNEQAFELMQTFLYTESAGRRNQEKEADSLGFKYYSATKYTDNEFVNAFKLLQRYDTIKPAGLSVDIYVKYFDLPDQKFKDEWLMVEDFSKYDYSKFVEKINKDSIASHPEAVERIQYLQKVFPELSKIKEAIPASDQFAELQSIAQWEEVPNMYFLKHYGMAIYVSLLNLERENAPEFYKYWLGKSFVKIYEARKQYKLNRYLDTVNPKEQSESYIQFLSFMWNLSLEELKNIAEYYGKVQN